MGGDLPLLSDPSPLVNAPISSTRSLDLRCDDVRAWYCGHDAVGDNASMKGTLVVAGGFIATSRACGNLVSNAPFE